MTSTDDCLSQSLAPRADTDAWWRDAVIYQIYPRSFASSHSAVGDLPGITSHLPYLAELGVDAV